MRNRASFDASSGTPSSSIGCVFPPTSLHESDGIRASSTSDATLARPIKMESKPTLL
jgi:hypothetical protein